MFHIWERMASDEEIMECHGDYIGCEVCRNQKRCFELLRQKLQVALASSGEVKMPNEEDE